MRVEITRHALGRWRERAALYADSPADELRQAFIIARPVADDEALPPHVNRCGGAKLFRRDDLDVYFVTQWPDPQTAVIVSVVRPRFGDARPVQPPQPTHRPTADELVRERYDVESRLRPKDMADADLAAERGRLLRRLPEVLGDLETANGLRRAILKQLRGKIKQRLSGIDGRLARVTT